MKEKSLAFRRSVDLFMKTVSMASALVGIFFLIWILWEVAARGLAAMDWNFFTKRTGPFMIEETGMANCIVGTAYMTLLSTIIGVPIGMLAGVFLAEFGRNHPLSTTVRFTSNILMGTPSILIGVFIYTIVVLPMGGYSGLAGGFALAIIMLPVVARTTEDILSLVPDTLRESALALGASHWKMIMQVVFRAARAGLVTGTLLAIARVSGETAPLLFTAFNNSHFTWMADSGAGRYIYDLGEPTANLTVTIFNYAMSPYDEWNAQAWGGSLLITGSILFISVIARIIFSKGRTRRV